MANQNNHCMLPFLLILTLHQIFSTNAVRMLDDSYLASISARKVNIDEHHGGFLPVRVRRDVSPASPAPTNHPPLKFTDVYLNNTDTHREAYMHWSGKKSNVIYILTCQRDRDTRKVIDSKLWKSTDYGSTYKNMSLGSPKTPAVISFLYVSPANSKMLVFTDSNDKKLYITTNELKDVTTVNIHFTPDRIKLHPRVEKYLMGYTLMQRKLYVSTDAGRTWKDFQEGVTQEIFWGNPDYGDTNETIHIEVQTSNGKACYKKCDITADCRQVECEASVGHFDLFSMLIIKEYIFVTKTMLWQSVMYVSYRRQDFKRAYFPPQTTTKEFMIVNADEGQVFISANHMTTSNLYLSDPTGQFYATSLNDTYFLPQPGMFEVDVYEVKGVKGTYIANKKFNDESQTLISFDKGGRWHKIPVPKTSKCSTSNCSLHLAIKGFMGFWGILSEVNAPGILLAHGNVGTYLNRQKPMSVFVSRDGGWTWNETNLAAGLYKFNLLDQGSVMTAIEDASGNATNTVYYSLDEGRTWQFEQFLSNKSIRVDGVLNEPGITTLVASVYGHDKRGSSWTVVKLNFSTVMTKKCEKADYEKWIPADQNENQKCILGQSITYERKKQDSLCVNGEDYERPIGTTNCTCEVEDFECDYGHILNAHYKCVKAPWFDSNTILNECQEGQDFNRSKGYRKVASDGCYGGVSNQSIYRPEIKKCPTVKPGGLKIVISQPVAATKSDVIFKLTQDMGSKLSTNYTWEFNDTSTPIKCTSLKNSSVTHSFTKYGTYNVTVNAVNTEGKVTASRIIRVEDKITNSIVSVPWATTVGHLTDFDVDVSGPQIKSKLAHIHFLWTFGDEREDVDRPALSWDRRIQHTYNKTGNYIVTVEAINSVSTVYKQFNIQVFDKGTILELSFSPNAELFHFATNTNIRMMFKQILTRLLTKNFGLSLNHLVVQLVSFSPVRAHILMLPSLNKDDISIDKIVRSIQEAAQNKTFPIPMDGQKDSRHVVFLVGVKIVTDEGPTTPKPHGPNLRAVYIAVPILLGAALVTILVLMYYRRRFRDVRRYSMLRSRGDSDALLGDDEDDDPPLDLNPDFGTSDRNDDDQLDLGTGSHLVMVTGRADGADNSVNC